MQGANQSTHSGIPAYVGAEVQTLWRRKTTIDRTLGYQFFPHFHPYVHELIVELITNSVKGLQAADTDRVPELFEELFTADQYDPNPDLVPDTQQSPHPVKDLDFTPGGAYSVYNWELFYHLPLIVAIHLSRNGRYEEAQRWFHYIFDPTDTSTGPTPQRFWKVKPFRTTDVKSIEEILVNLSTNADPKLRDETIRCINAWRAAPFRPHLVARFRQTPYMIKAVTAYLDNLIDWGDALFRQDTRESINEATQLYVLAANILGPRPQEVPRKGWQPPQTYKSLRSDVDQFGNAMRQVEPDIPFDLTPYATDVSDGANAQLVAVRSLGAALYFCLPRNDKLVGYWDTVADRLFKIRNSLNIQGVFRQLPLFEPPIDPALLAKATAAGLDISAVISGLYQPLPLVRFTFLIGKALELCQQVESLGNGLLSALEKEDGEKLAVMRARHETAVLKLAEVVKYQQWQEAKKATEGLQRSWQNAKERYRYYERLLGRDAADVDNQVTALEAADADALGKLDFSSEEPEVDLRTIDVDIAQDLDSAGGKIISSHEAEELDNLEGAHVAQVVAAGLELTGSTLVNIPTMTVDAKPMGVGGAVHFGGINLSQAASGLAAVSRIVADQLSYEAGMAARIGSYARREQEWALQSNISVGELNLIYKQLRAAQIRELSAEKEFTNHQAQIAQAQEIEEFLVNERNEQGKKTTSQAFYTWLSREVRGLYNQCFQLAFDVAKKAERALQHELGDPNRSFLQFGYLAGKEGLLAGEKLHLDLKRMEMAYHELNQREYELTKNVSLRQLDPVAFLQLRATGSCTVALPEESFDLDCPGHYFRRIKSVGLSIPCVVGPYTGVNCTLTLQYSSIRTSPAVGDGYSRDSDDTERFSDHFGNIQSVVTSTGSNDSGLFEPNLRDERYLPFEGSGGISRWQLTLPSKVPQFDHNTISDVVLHLRYTAREGGTPLRDAAVANLTGQITAATTVGSVRLLSVRQEFPTEWAKFTAVELDADTTRAPLTLTLRPEHYPFWATKFGPITLTKVELYAAGTGKSTVAVYDDPQTQTGTELTPVFDGLVANELSEPLPEATGAFTRYLNNNSMPDLWIALTWSGTPPA